MKNKTRTKSKETRKPDEVFEVRVTNLDREKGISKGEVEYYKSDRQFVWPRQTKRREELTKDGYYHLTSQDQRNGRMVFKKSPEIEVKMTIVKGGEMISQKKNVTNKIRKLLGKENRKDPITSESALKLAERINNRQVAVFMVNNQLFVEKS